MPIANYEDILPDREDFKLPLITELVDQSFVITEVRFGESNYGKYAVVTLDSGDQYRTSSTVLVQQLQRIEKALAPETDIIGIRVTLKKVKNYFTFQ